MSKLTLTDQERAAFCQGITRNRALDYFFVFDNAPLQFIYKDKVIPGELTDLEKRNKGITETVWLEAYHQYLVCNIGYLFLYRGPVLQMVFQVHQFGSGIFAPPRSRVRFPPPPNQYVEDKQGGISDELSAEGMTKHEYAALSGRLPAKAGGIHRAPSMGNALSAR